ncbi:DUF6923 family protein [Leucobacter sp. NPDC058333]|uniref:DUF7927 domain-containing protein n=1 Tax=Leucobacter sp. NPDC058333 TaxID=3346450 RepID=UPI00365E961D
MTLASAVVMTLATALSLTVPSAAQAAPGDPFDPTRPTVFVAQSQTGDPTRLYRSETAGDGSFSFTPEGPAVASGNYNAISFNRANNYMYGSVIGAIGGIPQNALVRIGQSGAVTRVGTMTFPIAQWAGAFNTDNGLLYTTNGAPGTSRTLYAVNTATGTIASQVQLSLTDYTLADMEYQDGFLWAFDYNGAQPAGTIVRINPQTGAMTRFAGVITGAPAGAWGAAWQFGNGNLGFSNNGNGTIAQLKITNGATATPTFEVVSLVAGPPAAGNDGTAIPGIPVDLAIEKSAAPTYAPGGQVSYTLTVTNNGAGESSGWTVQDSVPADLSNVTASGDATCSVTGNDVTCAGGRLALGASATITVTGTTAAAERDCFTNSASVIGNELDPVAANNEDSVEVCSRLLQIEKTSDATSATRVGDTVSYTVTATNAGAADFTVADPAFVADSLAGVVDDATYNNDAVATLPGTPTYSAPVVEWSGALGAGDSVDITYTVTMRSGGDGSVRNVAWAPGDPENPTPPACNPPVDGVDPTTGEACAEVEFELPRLTIEKSANRTDLPAIGDDVEYTVTVTNEGPGDYTAGAPATFTDDLSNVIDAATYNDDAAATAGTVSYNEPTLSWEGALASGESATVTYTATYTGEGDQNLRNVACIPAGEVAPGERACDLVQIPGADLTQWKQVSASATPAVAGTVLTYTLFFQNDGEADATVDAVDDLTYVLDDADVTVEPSSSDGLNPVRTGNQIAITGTVPAGTTSSVTYQVTVKADGDRGDDVSTNFLLAADEEPPTNPVCVPDDEQLPNCTATPIAAVSYSKAVEASTSPVVAGTVLTYTITVENTGAVAGPVAREDVLTDVLDDAELSADPESDTASVTVTDVQAGRFAIGGTLGAGETALVTYDVTVLPDADRGNNAANNFLVPPGEEPPADCDADSPECTSTPMPLITATKSVDVGTGATVVAGQEVTYTLTFANSGTAAGDVDYTDNLAGVLDDATLTGGPSSSDAALVANLGADDALAIAGELAAGQTVTVTYSVTVLPDGQRADNVLGNVLAPSDLENPECGDPGVSCTENPIPLLDSWKTVSASDSPVAAGTVLTYTLYFENSGAAAATVDEVDNLVHVTDDADVTTEPSSDDLLVARAGDVISIGGEVPAGETYSVTYQVTVRADGERGDDIAANFLLPEGQDPPATPVCQPTNSERPDCTVTPIGRLLTGKSVSADTNPIDVGTVLTYTLTFDNQGEGPVDVDHTDYLADVLDDATLTDDPEASDDALTASAVANDAFSVTGELAAGQTVTVTYRVTVNAEDERGNNEENNFLMPGDEEPPADCNAEDPNCTSTPLPLIAATKTADPDSGSGVQAGEQITYTLSFSNTGEAAGPVDYTDRLAEVLDDATLTGAPAASDPALTVSSGADGLVRVTGTLAADQTVTVTYSVTVNADGDRGDNMLRNVVAKSSVTDPECGDAGVSCTEHPVGELESWKTVDPASGATVRPGAELTYTLHFENTGNALTDVNQDDVLTEVLDDADVTVQPEASSDALVASEIADGRFNVSGTLAAGDSATVTYTVTVRAEGERGDDRLGNFLVPSGEAPPTGPCTPVDPARPNCTVNHVSDVSVVKSSDPKSGTEVGPNEKVTYTLTFTNASSDADGEPAAVDYTDHMADVLDDAKLVAGPAPSNDNLRAASEGGSIRITGTVAAGETYTVRYTVQVKSYESQGNHKLGNVIAVTGETPMCAPGSQLCTEHRLVPGPTLAVTGTSFAWMTAAAALMLLLAGGAVLVARRRVS